MIKLESRAYQLTYLVDTYDSIRNSRVSWRKKSSYRKPIKRAISKLIRRENKTQLKSNNYE